MKNDKAQMKKVKRGNPDSFYGSLPLNEAVLLGMQHIMAMFVGNLTPLIIILGACGITADAGFAELRTAVLQNSMTIAGIVTLVQLFSIGPCGGKVPIIMGTSSGFLGVFQSVVATMGQGVIAYGTILGASLIGGLFEGVLGACLKPFSGCIEGGMNREATDKELSGGIICDGLGSTSGATSAMPQAVQLIFGGSGIVPAAFAAIILNVVLPKQTK